MADETYELLKKTSAGIDNFMGKQDAVDEPNFTNSITLYKIPNLKNLKKRSVKDKRLDEVWNNDYFLKILNN